MWHLPFIFLFIQWLQPALQGWSPEQAYLVYWLWVLVVVVPFCLLFFKWVEKPGMKLGERFRPRKASPAYAVTPRMLSPGRLSEKEEVESKS